MADTGKKGKSKLHGAISTMIVLFPMVYFLRSTVVFLMLTMMPTLASLFIETKNGSRYKYKWLCIGGLNFAGALPFMFKMWFTDNTIWGAIAMFFSIKTILVTFGAAALGLLFARTIPMFVLTFIETKDQRRVLALKEIQKKMVEKWGEDVTVFQAKKPLR